MYEVVKKTNPEKFSWTEAVRTLTGMRPGRNEAFFVPIRLGKSLMHAQSSLERSAGRKKIRVIVKMDIGDGYAENKKRGLWVWRA